MEKLYKYNIKNQLNILMLLIKYQNFVLEKNYNFNKYDKLKKGFVTDTPNIYFSLYSVLTDTKNVFRTSLNEIIEGTTPREILNNDDYLHSLVIHELNDKKLFIVSEKYNKMYIVNEVDKQVGLSGNKIYISVVFTELNTQFLNYLCLKEVFSYKNVKIPVHKSFTALRDLWIVQNTHQASDGLVEVDNINSYKNKEYTYLIESLGYILNKKKNESVTYLDVVELYNEIINKELTPNTASGQNWLFMENNEYVFEEKDISTLEKGIFLNKQLGSNLKSLKMISPDVFKQQQPEAFNSMLGLTSIKYIYEITQEFKGNPEDFYKDSEDYLYDCAWHGTKPESVLSILNLGLKSSDSLRDISQEHVSVNEFDTIDYDYTGNSLGTGVYLAPLENTEKSISFAGGRRSSYKFMLLTAYKYKTKVKKVKNPKTKKEEEVVEEIGIVSRQGRSKGKKSEICVQNDKDVCITHLVICE